MTNTLTFVIGKSSLHISLDDEGKLVAVAHIHATDNNGQDVQMAQRVQLQANSVQAAQSSLTAAQITALESILATVAQDAATLQGFV